MNGFDAPQHNRADCAIESAISSPDVTKGLSLFSMLDMPFMMLNVNRGPSPNRIEHYKKTLDELDQASRRHAGATSERGDLQGARADAIVGVSRWGVPRATVAKLTGLTAGRVQQILESAGASGATGDDWADPALRRLVKEVIATRPIPSVGIGLRRESTLGPHMGRGYGGAIRLTGNLNQDRADVVETLETLAERAGQGDFDDLLSLTCEENDLLKGRLVD